MFFQRLFEKPITYKRHPHFPPEKGASTVSVETFGKPPSRTPEQIPNRIIQNRRLTSGAEAGGHE